MPAAISSEQLLDAAAHLAGTDVTWEDVGVAVALNSAVDLQLATSRDPDLEAARHGSRMLVRVATDVLACGDQRQLLARFATDLLAAHRQPASVPYDRASSAPHRSVTRATTSAGPIAAACWPTWYAAHRRGVGAGDLLDAVLAAAHDHGSGDPTVDAMTAVELVQRWETACASIVDGAGYQDPAVVGTRGLETLALQRAVDPLLLAAYGRYGATSTRAGYTLMFVPGVVARWAERHTALRDYVRVVQPDADTSGVDDLVGLLDGPGSAALLDALWEEHLRELDTHEEIHTVPGPSEAP